MTALASSDVTFTADAGGRVVGARNKRMVLGTLAFGDGSKTYPANGVPLPVPAAGVGGMGLGRKMDYLDLIDSNNAGDGLIYKFDAAHNTIRIYNPTQQTGGTGNRAGVELSGAAVAATSLKVRTSGI